MALSTLAGGRGRLKSDAAASIARIDKQRGRKLTINSAFRSEAEQRALIARWNRGGKYNRPPYLYQPAMHPPFPHTSGRAIDTSEIWWMLTYGRAHGWRRPFAYDKVHFQYYPHLDKKKAKPDTRKVYFDPERKAYYLAGKYNGKPYVKGSRRKATRDHWVKRWGKADPFNRSLAQIRKIAGF